MDSKKNNITINIVELIFVDNFSVNSVDAFSFATIKDNLCANGFGGLLLLKVESFPVL